MSVSDDEVYAAAEHLDPAARSAVYDYLTTPSPTEEDILRTMDAVAPGIVGRLRIFLEETP